MMWYDTRTARQGRRGAARQCKAGLVLAGTACERLGTPACAEPLPFRRAA